MKENAIDAVVVQTMAHGRYGFIIDDTDQRVLFRLSEIAAVIIRISDFQYFAHKVYQFAIQLQRYLFFAVKT